MAYVKASARIASVVRAGLQPHLKTLGYKKASLTWSLCDPAPITRLVQVQLSHGNSGANGSFVLELGVYLPAIERLVFSRPIATPKAYQCTARKRFGPKRRGADPWWEVDSDTDEEVLAADVVGRFRSVGEPWLTRAANLVQLDDAIDNDPKFAWYQEPLAPVATMSSVRGSPTL